MSDLPQRARSAAPPWIVVGGVVVLVVAAVGWLPGWLVGLDVDDRALSPAERAGAVNAIRTTLLQAIAGLVLAYGAYATWRRLRINEQELRATRDGQNTERYSRAIEHLGSDNVDVRMGGIFALERLARNSPDDRDTIVAVLCAYVRGHAPWPPRRPEQPPAATSPADLVSLAVRANDVQAALTVLGRIQLQPGEEEISIPRSDLRYARLNGARLEAANLGSAELTRVRLRHAVLREARLARSNLRQAELQGADLRGADLREATLDGADLTGARADGRTRWPVGFDPSAAGVVT